MSTAPRHAAPRISVLLPLVPEAVLHAQDDQDFHPETNREVLIPKPIKKKRNERHDVSSFQFRFCHTAN